MIRPELSKPQPANDPQTALSLREQYSHIESIIVNAAAVSGPELFRHFIEQLRSLTGSLYGRGMYEVMRYWDEDVPEWNAEERDFAAAWRGQPKWVVSRSLRAVGPNATLVKNDLEAAVRRLKAKHAGQIEVAGPKLAQSLTDLGLIDICSSRGPGGSGTSHETTDSCQPSTTS